MTGTVVTFYSYKGGVGRSFALANIAVLLGRWGFRVLCIDWDLEAPGLAYFFETAEFNLNSKRPLSRPPCGLVELLLDFKSKKQVPLEWRDYVLHFDQELPGVSLMKAGNEDQSYTQRLHKLNWSGLYRGGLGDALEVMFEDLRENFDYVLIDARTGVTDFSGIITAQLPDILAFLFTANEQSFRGATDVARRAAQARNDLAVDRSRLMLLPLPARFETQLEHSISALWRKRFSEELQEFYAPWAVPEAPSSRMVQATTIPYVPFWSFGERLSVLEDKSTDSLSINYSLETIAALLAHRLGQTRLLLESRDEFVSSAKRLAQKRDQDQVSIFISYSSEDKDVASALARSLERRGFRTFKNDFSTGLPIETSFNEAIDRSDHMVVLLGDQSRGSRWQDHEIRSFLRQAAADEGSRLLIPFQIKEADAENIPVILRQYKVTTLRDEYESAAERIVDLIRPTTQSVSRHENVLQLITTADGGIPIQGVSVTALNTNGTTLDTVSGSDGKASLSLLRGRAYTLLFSHPKYAARIIEDFEIDSILDVRLQVKAGVGSVIMHSTGHIPGLNGRLNPILDTSNRTYLYADNIAVNGGQAQPAAFAQNEPLELEDAQGSKFEVVVKMIAGRTSLLEYRRLT